MREGLAFGIGAVDNMNERRAKCPRCGTEYDVFAEAASEAMGGLCAACWHDRCEKNIREGRGREARGIEKTTSIES